MHQLLFQQAYHTVGEAIKNAFFWLICDRFLLNWNLHKHYECVSEGGVLLIPSISNSDCDLENIFL